MHSKGFVHRDIKPDNFLMGVRSSLHPSSAAAAALTADGHELDTSRLVYMIDFGLAKKFRDPRTKSHIPYREGKQLTGTARYASNNTHAGREQSRRDDLESLGYVFVYFLVGRLPWQGLKNPYEGLNPGPGLSPGEIAMRREDWDRRKNDLIGNTKASLPIEVLCKGLPREFADYFTYVRSLRFDDRPDYGALRSMFLDLASAAGLVLDEFDWGPL